MDPKVSEAEDEDLAALPYIDDTERFTRLMRVIENGTVISVLQVTDKPGDAE